MYINFNSQCHVHIQQLSSMNQNNLLYKISINLNGINFVSFFAMIIFVLYCKHKCLSFYKKKYTSAYAYFIYVSVTLCYK